MTGSGPATSRTLEQSGRRQRDGVRHLQIAAVQVAGLLCNRLVGRGAVMASPRVICLAALTAWPPATGTGTIRGNTRDSGAIASASMLPTVRLLEQYFYVCRADSWAHFSGYSRPDHFVLGGKQGRGLLR